MTRSATPATRNSATWRVKPPKATTFAALPIGTAIGPSPRSCWRRLQTQKQHRANTGPPLDPQSKTRTLRCPFRRKLLREFYLYRLYLCMYVYIYRDFNCHGWLPDGNKMINSGGLAFRILRQHHITRHITQETVRSVFERSGRKPLCPMVPPSKSIGSTCAVVVSDPWVRNFPLAWEGRTGLKSWLWWRFDPAMKRSWELLITGSDLAMALNSLTATKNMAAPDQNCDPAGTLSTLPKSQVPCPNPLPATPSWLLQLNGSVPLK